MDGIILTRHLFIVPLMALSFGGVADTVRVLNGHALAASQESRSGLPTLNIDSACRDVSSNELNRTSDYPGCVSKEQKARTDLGKEWASYSSDMQSQCMHLVTPPALPSYVTLQQCLQMSRDARNLSKKDGASQIGNTMHPSRD